MSRRQEYEQRLQNERISNMSTKLTICAMAMALKHKHGFGTKRINELIEQTLKEIDGVSRGMIGVENYIEYVKEQTGVKL